MVVEAQLVVDDAVVDVVGLEQVLERARALLWLLFDIVNVRLWQLDAAVEEATPRRQRRGSEVEHGGGRAEVEAGSVGLMRKMDSGGCRTACKVVSYTVPPIIRVDPAASVVL